VGERWRFEAARRCAGHRHRVEKRSRRWNGEPQVAGGQQRYCWRITDFGAEKGSGRR